ncbi:transaldolase family protein [Acetanaerobacterium elongatum]|uniref:Transaldolase n=1 Tax=Acetanaerobacterium elongatum TaxID=258515 RepID=A0A1H0EEX3_9FIRM|nr:transaldolase family protein [Acetanaerobacterium elongatum]SDN81047.1 transaldolase [Acetanaerobacterium elongatum]
MKYFLDSAKLDEIKFAYENYTIDGVTTNPKHIKLSGKPFMQCVRDIAAWLKETGLEGKDFPVSFEINPHLEKWEDIVEAAKEVSSYSKNYVIKIPCCEQGLIAAKKLEKMGVRTNVTLVFSPSQAIPAAKLGAKFVSPFVGWKENSGEDAFSYISEIVKIYRTSGYDTEIIVAAVRNGKQIADYAAIGADIVTCGLQVYQDSFEHPFTGYGLNIFREAWDTTAKA